MHCTLQTPVFTYIYLIHSFYLISYKLCGPTLSQTQTLQAWVLGCSAAGTPDQAVQKISSAVVVVLLHPYWKRGEPGSPISYQLSSPSWKKLWSAAPWSGWNPFSPRQRFGHTVPPKQFVCQSISRYQGKTYSSSHHALSLESHTVSPGPQPII